MLQPMYDFYEEFTMENNFRPYLESFERLLVEHPAHHFPKEVVISRLCIDILYVRQFLERSMFSPQPLELLRHIG